MPCQHYQAELLDKQFCEFGRKDMQWWVFYQVVAVRLMGVSHVYPRGAWRPKAACWEFHLSETHRYTKVLELKRVSGSVDYRSLL
jgi:hypothetical protein